MEKNTLGKNALLNGIKTLCSIIFPFISFSYCSRVLGAEELGAYSFGQSIIAYLLLVAALGIPNYAIREGAFLREKKNELNSFISEVFTINCIMTIVAYMILGLLLITWNKLDGYKYILIIQSVQILLTTLGADWINSIFENYYYLAIRYIIIQIVSLIALIIFVKSQDDIYVYTFISVMSNAGGNILNWHYIKKQSVRLRFSVKRTIRKHFLPIFVLFFYSIASTIYLNSDITMLGIYDNDAAVGIYTVSSKIYSMTKTLLVSVIMVTLPRFSHYIAEEKNAEYKTTINSVQNALIIFTLPASVGLFWEADKVLGLVAGPAYISGVLVVKILAIAIPFAVEACFFTYSILMPNRKECYFLTATIVAALLNIGLNVVLIPQYSIFAAALTTLIAEMVITLLTGICSNKMMRVSINKKTIFQALVGCIGVTLVCCTVEMTYLSSNIKLLLDIVIGCGVYIILLATLKCDILVNLIKHIKDRA